MGIASFFLFACLFLKKGGSGTKQGSRVSRVGDGFEGRGGNQLSPLARNLGQQNGKLTAGKHLLGVLYYTSQAGRS